MDAAITIQTESVNHLPITSIFGREASLEVDIGCGKGRFLAARASAHPEVNFLGIERRLRRVKSLETKIRGLALQNARVLHAEASHAVEHLLPASIVSVFYVFFPDPWPKRRHHRRRLFSPAFLNALHRALVPDGRIHLATDHAGYLDVIADLFRNDARFVQTERFEPTMQESTEFEETFRRQGRRIERVSYRRV